MGLICGNWVVDNWHQIFSSDVAVDGKLSMLLQR